MTAPRQSALIERDVEHLDLRRSRIDYGESNTNKRRGAGALDTATLAELADDVGQRSSGPLFPGPAGDRQTVERLLDRWREAFSLGLLDALWPRDLPWDLDKAILLNSALLQGRVRVSRGGNPLLLRPETLAAQAALADEIETLVERFRDDWEANIKGVDVHAFRKTHRTWAVAKGVPGVLIDLQLGHAHDESPETLDVMRAIAGSRTGRRHYVDLDSPLLDPQRSAEAVREVLDKAITALEANPTHLRAQPSGRRAAKLPS